VYVYTHTHTHAHIYRERERERGAIVILHTSPSHNFVFEIVPSEEQRCKILFLTEKGEKNIRVWKG
jgi:hypothetical protein